MAQKSNNLILETLLQAQKSGELVEVYDDPDTINSFSVGKILQVDTETETLLFSDFDEPGEWNGIVMIKIADIIKINQGSNYLTEIQLPMKLIAEDKLPGYHGERERGLDALPKFDKLDIQSVLQKTKEAKQFCELMLDLTDNPRLYGYVEAVGEDTIGFHEFSKWGVDLGVNHLKIADIKSVWFFCYQALMRERFSCARGGT